jgi:hypothetical protein
MGEGEVLYPVIQHNKGVFHTSNHVCKDHKGQVYTNGSGMSCGRPSGGVGGSSSACLCDNNAHAACSFAVCLLHLVRPFSESSERPARM